MLTVFRHEGFRFFFYSNEGNPREPVHIHAMKDGGEAKVWLHPVAVARSSGLDARALRDLSRIVALNTARIEEALHEHFGN